MSCRNTVKGPGQTESPEPDHHDHKSHPLLFPIILAIVVVVVAVAMFFGWGK